jgi:hypothetical protein
MPVLGEAERAAEFGSDTETYGCFTSAKEGKPLNLFEMISLTSPNCKRVPLLKWPRA